MKGEVPGCEPGIFPLVRHRDDIRDNKVSPIAVAPVLPVLRRRRLSWIAIQPTLHIEVIKLLVPQHSGEGLTLYPPHVLVDNAFLERGVKGIGLGNALGKNIIEAVKAARSFLPSGEPHPDRSATPSRDLAEVKSSDFRAVAGSVYRFGIVVDNVFVKRVLEVAWRGTTAEQSVGIGFVVAEQQAIRALEVNAKFTQLRVPSEDDAVALIFQRWLLGASRPTPDVAEPSLRKDMHRSLIRASVINRHPH